MLDKIKKLRNMTGLSFDEIKKALEESNSDEVKAIEILKKRGIAIAAKKSERSVGEGIIETYIHATKKLASVVELLCESDFVAKNMEFQNLAHELAMHIAAMKPNDLDELMSQPFVKDPEMTIKDLINQVIAKLGENIQIRKFQIFEI